MLKSTPTCDLSLVSPTHQSIAVLDRDADRGHSDEVCNVGLLVADWRLSEVRIRASGKLAITPENSVVLS